MARKIIQENDDLDEFVGYLKFYGPSVDGGKIDIEKIGESLLALNKIYKKYSKKCGKKDIVIKLGGIKKNCTEVNVFFEQIIPVIQPVADTTSFLLIAKSIGVTEFGKQFFGTIGQQLGLKIFAKGSRIKKVKDVIRDGNLFVKIKNLDGEEKIISKEIYDTRNDYSNYIDDLVQLEEGKEERMKIGYYKESTQKDIAEIKLSDKKFFKFSEDDSVFENKLDEDFNDFESEEVRIAGKFIDYYGLAHKYHFSFQARENQEDIGKQKILCMVNVEKISKIIDFLKPENQKRNIYIFGRANRNLDGKIEKIKIEWVSINENYNPNQKKLIW